MLYCIMYVNKIKLALKSPLLTLYWIYRRVFLFITRPISCFLKDMLYSHHYIFWWWLYGSKRATISPTAIINDAFLNVNSWRIVIKDYVFTWHGASLITWSHDYNKFNFERIVTSSPTWNDIIIEQWVWIWAHSIVLWPCTIWEHSVIAAWAVVTKDIPAYEIWWWVPAKFIKKIDIL